MSINLNISRVLALCTLCSLLGSGFGILVGYTKGVDVVHAQWRIAESQYQQELATLRAEQVQAAQTYAQKEKKLHDQIAKNSTEHSAALAAATYDYTERLRKSTNRVQAYADMSEAAADERRALANHAANLDRALEEGRYLVRELRETLGQRDREIMLLGEHIQNVYQLINNTGNSNGTPDSGNS